MEQDNNIGKRLKELREYHGFTQTQVADYLGIDQSNYSKMEHGKRRLRKFSMLKKLCTLYQCTEKYILYGTGEYEPQQKWENIPKGIDISPIAKANETMATLKTLRTIQKNSRQ